MEMTINPDTANYTIPITDMDERLRIILFMDGRGIQERQP